MQQTSNDPYQIGNFVNYFSSHLCKLDFSQITAIQPHKDGSLIYSLRHKRKVGFDGYPEHISSILLEPNHLALIGFKQKGATATFLYPEIFLQPEIMVFFMDDLADPSRPKLRVKKFGDTQAKYNQPITEYLEENSEDISHVHTFQNYCALNGINIHFSALAR